LRELLWLAPEASAFLRYWPKALIARPTHPRSLPVLGTLRGLSRLAAPRTQGLVEAVEAAAGEHDRQQTYEPADLGERFLENYRLSEWNGQRGTFMSDRVAGI
jgi:hypothetical protein